MTLLEELHYKIDLEDWDIKDEDVINKEYQNLNGKLADSGEHELIKLSEKEREVFAFSKTPGGLKWKLSGTKTMDGGTQVPMEWPDIKTWGGEDFEYIYKMFLQLKNTYARTEFGLILYFNGKLKPNECKTLFNDLIVLSKKYYNGIKGKEKASYYAVHFYNSLAIALKIAYYKRKAPGFTNEMHSALQLAEEIHKEWDQAGKYLLRTVIDLTDLVLQYITISIEVVDLKGFFDRNNKAAYEIVKTYTWGGIYIIDENIKLAGFLNLHTRDLIKLKAELYEKLAEERKVGDLAIITFNETALRLFKEIDDKENIERMEEVFRKSKTEGNYGQVSSELEKEESERIGAIIQKEIAEKNEEQILELIANCPMFSTLETIEKMAEDWKKNAVLSFMVGANISDKFGNTIARYPGNSDEWAFMQSYNLQFQIGIQTLVYFFINAFKAGKINEAGIVTFLENSWMGEAIIRNYNNQQTSIIPLDTVKPAIKNLMTELNTWKNEEGYVPNFILAIDSLTLKIEALLRYFCDRLRISTFKLRDDGLVMERNLDEILASLEHKSFNTNFVEEDRKYIKFVLSEKAGENLRNKVAHGLMDNFEFSIDKVVLTFSIILRLTKYKFQHNEKATE